jgi:hypothetical protein
VVVSVAATAAVIEAGTRQSRCVWLWNLSLQCVAPHQQTSNCPSCSSFMDRKKLCKTTLSVTALTVMQLTRGFTQSDSVLHTDLLTDRLATEDYQRYRSVVVGLCGIRA